MIRQKISEIKQGQQLRKQYGERRAVAEAELQKKIGKAPRLSEADRATVQSHLASIDQHNAFTFNFHAELKEQDLEYSSVYVRGSTQYEHANREAMHLKKEIKRILNPYLSFWHKEPDPETLVFYKSKEYRYPNPDKEVLSLLDAVNEKRNYGEEEMFQLKKLGVNIPHILGISERELNG